MIFYLELTWNLIQNKKHNIEYHLFITQILVREDFFERPSLIESTHYIFLKTL